MTTLTDAAGVTRQGYYGEPGRQPWDSIVELGWGASFAAGNVLKYLRRRKGEPAKDLEKARWYWDRLLELRRRDRGRSVYFRLIGELTEAERAALERR